MTRKALGLRLEDVALTAGVGIRFLSELERGKQTARLSQTFLVLDALGITLSLTAPDDA